jgi:addiction module RelB/DinJ family antitoxin
VILVTKDTNISIRLDSRLKEQTEDILAQFGLSMTTVVNMLFHQIVRERTIPLSLSLNPASSVIDELNWAKEYRLGGHRGRDADSVADDMVKIITDEEHARR